MSKDSRLRLTEICCRIKLNRDVNLEDRVWMTKLVESDSDAAKLASLHLPLDWNIIQSVDPMACSTIGSARSC